jgi:uncharacterized membrane-anchored protein YitT (DUF2179 family)
MIEDILLLVVGIAFVLFGIQNFLTENRRKFANEMIKAAAMVIMGLFILYYWQVNVNLPVGGGSSNYR